MKLLQEFADVVVAVVATACVAVAFYVTRDTPHPTLSAAARFISDCPTTTQYEIWHAGPQRSMQITCEGPTK